MERSGYISDKLADRLPLLYDVSRGLSGLIELDQLVSYVVSRVTELLEAESTAVLLLDGQRQEFYFPYAADVDPAIQERLAAVRFPADRGLAGWVAQHATPQLVLDVSTDPRWYADVDTRSGGKTHSLLCAPLRTRQGVIGVLEVRNRRQGAFTDADLAFLDALGGSVAVAIENARLYANLKRSEERLRLQVVALRRDLAHRDGFTKIVGHSRGISEVLRLMESAAASPLTVLIEGETGTGKELVARGIHVASERTDAPFVAVNCAGLSETLLESELFGHVRGAFTGANQDRRGFFEAADRGTILLDEVGDMPLNMQAKLLRVLQDGQVTPVGETRPRQTNVRVICATNRDLGAEVNRGAFRPDLYYRLAAFPIRVPPLRERPEDVPLLAEHFAQLAAARHRKRIAGIDSCLIETLMTREWPGNVRELQNRIEHAVALARDGDTLGAAHLGYMPPPAALPPVAAMPSSAPATVNRQAAAPPAVASEPLRVARAGFEARYIAEVLQREGGNISRAARRLGLSRVSLYQKLRAYGLATPSAQ